MAKLVLIREHVAAWQLVAPRAKWAVATICFGRENGFPCRAW